MSPQRLQLTLKLIQEKFSELKEDLKLYMKEPPYVFEDLLRMANFKTCSGKTIRLKQQKKAFWTSRQKDQITYMRTLLTVSICRTKAK